MKMQKFVIAACLVCVASMAHGQTRIYGFDDGTFQGWNYVDVDGLPLSIGEGENQSIGGWAVTIDDVDAGGDEGFDVLQGSTVDGIGEVGNPQRNPNHRVLPFPFANRDQSAISQILRSPFFRIGDSGPISVDMMGGQAQGGRSFDPETDTPPEFPEDHNYEKGPGGWQGYGLYDIAEDSYVRWGFPTFNNDGKERDGRDVWETVSIPQEELAELAGDGKYYRLDIFDSYSGGWGWIAFDTVKIPESTVEVTWDGGDGQWSDPNWNSGGTLEELVGSTNGSNGAESLNGGETFIIGGGATVSYDGNTLGDLRIKQGSNLIIQEGATLAQTTLPTWSENRWTQMDLSRLEINGGTFSRTGAAPLGGPEDPLGGGALIFGSWRGDDNFDTVNAPQTISVSISEGGSLVNEGQLWFGGWEDHPEGLTVGMTIYDGSIDLTGGDVEGVGEEADADLVFTYGRNGAGDPKNENYSLNFAGPGSLTVDRSGIIVAVKDEDNVWTGLDPITYEELWDMGILQSLGQSGLNDADFSEYFEVTGELGQDNYMLTSLLTPGEGLIGDCNMDGVLNADDLTCVGTIEERDAVLAALNTLPGDLDGNGEVEFPDFLTLSGNYNVEGLNYTEGNIDLVGAVDFTDFLALSGNFGKTVEGVAASVPEPSTGLLAGVLGLFAMTVRRRRNS